MSPTTTRGGRKPPLPSPTERPARSEHASDPDTGARDPHSATMAYRQIAMACQRPTCRRPFSPAPCSQPVIHGSFHTLEIYCVALPCRSGPDGPRMAVLYTCRQEKGTETHKRRERGGHSVSVGRVGVKIGWRSPPWMGSTTPNANSAYTRPTCSSPGSVGAPLIQATAQTPWGRNHRARDAAALVQHRARCQEHALPTSRARPADSAACPRNGGRRADEGARPTRHGDGRFRPFCADSRRCGYVMWPMDNTISCRPRSSKKPPPAALSADGSIKYYFFLSVRAALRDAPPACGRRTSVGIIDWTTCVTS